MSHIYKTAAAGFNSRVTPQSLPIPGKTQKINNAGGYTFTLDIWKQLERFLILGTEGGTFYVTPKSQTKKNTDNVMKCITTDPKRTVDVVVEISQGGRAIKNDPAILVLAMVSGLASDAGKKYALENLSKVCQTGTHLFTFADYVQQFRGWGIGLRKAISKWYLEKSSHNLEFQLLKYRQRNGWSHKDLLRLAHVHPKDEFTNLMFRYVTKDTPISINVAPMLYAFEQVKASQDEKEIIKLIEKFDLPLEAIPTEKQTDNILAALIPQMGLTGLIRNLGRLTSKGILTQESEYTKFIVERILSEGALKKARVHPFSVLLALTTYKSGKGIKGGLTWSPVAKLLDALDEAFYLAFGNVESTGLRILDGIDISGSMDGNMIISGYDQKGNPIPTNVDARMAAACMAMVNARVEPNVSMYGFTSGRAGSFSDSSLTPLSISKRQRIDDICSYMENLPMGGTDCSLPIRYALEKGIAVDAFRIFTDNETWAGNIHASQCLNLYRQESGINAKLIVVGFTSTEFTIADPNDPNSMDVVGFDGNAPQIMTDFMLGKI